jgi:hypothetical protein
LNDTIISFHVVIFLFPRGPEEEGVQEGEEEVPEGTREDPVYAYCHVPSLLLGEEGRSHGPVFQVLLGPGDVEFLDSKEGYPP